MHEIWYEILTELLTKKYIGILVIIVFCAFVIGYSYRLIRDLAKTEEVILSLKNSIATNELDILSIKAEITVVKRDHRALFDWHKEAVKESNSNVKDLGKNINALITTMNKHSYVIEGFDKTINTILEVKERNVVIERMLFEMNHSIEELKKKG